MINIFIYTFPPITFERKCVLFHVNKRHFYKGHFRNSVNECTFARILDRF